MGKPSKSSASAGTRKKQIRKAAARDEDNQPQQQQTAKTKGGKKNKKEPRVKMYIPPAKPQPLQRDPIDVLGLGSVLPADLLVVLRRLMKKDAVTKQKALEELQAAWIDKACKPPKSHEDPQGDLVETLCMALPVWLHHYPALCLHPSRRIRLLNASLHASLLQVPSLQQGIVRFLRDASNYDQIESVLGMWMLSQYDVDRQVTSTGRTSWKSFFRSSTNQPESIEIDGDDLKLLETFTTRAVLDPGALYNSFYPVQSAVQTPIGTPHRGKAPARVASTSAVRSPEEPGIPGLRGSLAGEDGESEGDRYARIRIAALGSMKWLLDSSELLTRLDEGQGFDALLANVEFWTILSHKEHPPFIGDEQEVLSTNYGNSQPGVRRAGWGLLLTLVQKHKERLQNALHAISVATLRSVWVEPDTIVRGACWEPFLLFLTTFPRAWLLSDAGDEESDREDEGFSSSTNPAYQEMLDFLRLGCAGTAVQSYPQTPLVIWTIPPEVLPLRSNTLEEYFSAFWAAIDGQALAASDRTTASFRAFLSAYVECLLLIVRRIESSTSEGPSNGKKPQTLSKDLLSNQFGLIWERVFDGSLRIEPEEAVPILAKAMSRFQSLHDDIFSSVWTRTVEAILAAYMAPASSDPTPPLNWSAWLSGFAKEFTSDHLKAPLNLLIDQIIRSSVSQLLDPASEATVRNRHAQLLKGAIEGIQNANGEQETVVQLLDEVFKNGLPSLFRNLEPTAFIDLAIAYFQTRGSGNPTAQVVWSNLLTLIGDYSDWPMVQRSMLLRLLEVADLPAFRDLRADKGQLENFLGVTRSTDYEATVPVLISLLLHYKQFMDIRSAKAAVNDYESRIWVSSLAPKAESPFSIPCIIDALRGVNALLQEQDIDLLSTRDERLSLPAYVFGHLPYDLDPTLKTLAKDLWRQVYLTDPTACKGRIVRQTRIWLTEVSCPYSPEELVDGLAEIYVSDTSSIWESIIPAPAELDALVEELPAFPDPTLAAFDVLIPEEHEEEPPFKHSEALPAFLRVVCAMVQLLGIDRQLSAEKVWALEYVLLAECFILQAQSVPHSSQAVFPADTEPSLLYRILTQISKVTTYQLALIGNEENLHSSVTKAIQSKNRPTMNGYQQFLYDLYQKAFKENSVQLSLVLRLVLQYVLKTASGADGDLWLSVARTKRDQSAQTSLSISSALVQNGLETHALDRYRNEIASAITGIPPSRADNEGVMLLRHLLALAPQPESEVAFLPPTRAVQVLQTIHKWTTSDEELEPVIESQTTGLLLHLAPIVQSLPGAHWAFAFDLIENTLETLQLQEEESVVHLSRTLSLVSEVQNLASTNKSLRSQWYERRATILRLVRDLLLVKLDPTQLSAPREACREKALILMQDIPPGIIEKESFPKMCSLLHDSKLEVQRISYPLVRAAGQKQTEAIVLEAGLDTTGRNEFGLPQELINLLYTTRFLGDAEADVMEEAINSRWFGYLLGWNVALDMFENTSLRVRNGYIDQLRTLDLVSRHLLPSLCLILHIGHSRVKSPKLDLWEIDTFYIPFYEPDFIQVFAAHIYYRALLTLPSLIRAWWTDNKDRQMSNSFSSFTSTYFSPVLIAAELQLLRQPPEETGREKLDDDSLTVKISMASSEVGVVYVIDEQQMELALRLPAEYPLKPVDVRDVRRVGVTESKWRAWLLAIQQLITIQNGHIIDGLLLFKRNVSLHFEGQVECAICYSIISVADLSLPTKPCRTCKNRFHSSCLYRWFKSSSSSSCPLCRSDIF